MRNKSNLCIVKEASAYLKRALPVLGFAGATLFTSCEKDEPTIPLHDTTYVWGRNNMAQLFPTDNVVASADSTSVRTVYLHSDGAPWGGAFNMTELREWVLEPVLNDIPEHNRHKIKGSGIINQPLFRTDDKQMFTKQYEDSVWLSKMGFIIKAPIYSPVVRDAYVYGR